jgi:DNA-binding NarL/FixJ family response regulator
MRVYILSPYPAVRAGLAALLRDQPGWSVAGVASSQALAPAAMTDDTAPSDVVLADVDALPDAETVEAWLAALRPRGGIVLLGPLGGPSVTPGRGRRGAGGQTDDLRELAELSRATEAQGVGLGILPREATPEEVTAALTAVAGGLIALDRRVAGALLAVGERMPAPVTDAPEVAGEPLTARELDVLQLLAQGLPNKLIANRLRISEHTAKFHVSSIMTKLGAASRTEAVTLAARRGLLIL